VIRRSLLPFILLGLIAAPAVAAEGHVAGGSDTESRVVGGIEVDPEGKYPWMAALVWSGTPNAENGLRCGAALISNTWVITAAHCFGGALGPDDFDIVVGRHELSSSDGDRVGIAEIISHPDFDDFTLENDIALVRLETPAAAGAPIAWAREADAAAFGPGSIATVTGWGDTENSPPGTPSFPDGLREADVPIQSTGDCRASYGSEFFSDLMICAGFPSGGTDTCQGDSGGPMVVWASDHYIHIGITSWGEGCADPGFAGVYTRTATYASWISSTTGLVAGKMCEGLPANLVGTNGADILVGSSGPDVIVGRGGDDDIRGMGGDDVVCAGKGNDTVRGGSGDDLLLGQKGDDLLIGQAGEDVLYGKAGADELRGGADDDELRGGSGDDLLKGHGGADALYGGPGTDTCAVDEPIVVSCEIDP
jgi:Ca2+-binding RTX toxin-like protein